MAMRGEFVRRFAIAGSAGLAAICGLAGGPASAQQSDDAVARGEYLAIAGNCTSCHTVEGGDPFAGGVLFQTDFGKIYSTNITPDAENGIGDWTEEDFHRAMRKGVRADGAHLYPAFPYTAYTKVTDEDISALWAYLQTLAPSSTPATPNEMGFPYNQRWLMGAWNMLFFKEGAFEPDPEQSEEWNRGAYLVEGLGHCSACHTPRNGLGAEQTGKFLTGGTLIDKVGHGDKMLPWYAIDLTPSHAGLREWTAEDIASYLKTGISSRGGVHGPMNEVVSNSTRHLEQSDIDAIATYLTALPARDASPGRPSEQQIAAGQIYYDIYCGTCHLPTGLGIEDSSPPLDGNAIVNSADPSTLLNVILYGAAKPSNWTPDVHWEKTMDPFAGELRDREIAGIANFIRGSWSNAASPVTEEEVAARR